MSLKHVCLNKALGSIPSRAATLEKGLMMYVAIGDIHAYDDKFLSLMGKLLVEGVDFETDTLVFLGDYVDGGHNARFVINLLRELEESYPHFVFLKGNHEDMMLDAVVHNSRRYRNFNQWYGQGGAETLKSYQRDSTLFGLDLALAGVRDIIGKEHLNWLEQLPLYHETDDYIFVHGGLKEGKQPSECDDITLLWARYEFLQSNYDWGKKVICGHTYHEEPLVKENIICIDTMYHGGGSLTALLLDDEIRFIQSDV
jgi:serine/threonine protein phosphatase 1